MMALFRNFKNEVLNMSLFLGLMSLKCAQKKNVLFTLQQGSLVQRKKICSLNSEMMWEILSMRHAVGYFSASANLLLFVANCNIFSTKFFYYLLYIKAWNLLSLRLSGLKALGCISKYHKFHSFFIILICCLYLLHKWVFD